VRCPLLAASFKEERYGDPVGPILYYMAYLENVQAGKEVLKARGGGLVVCYLNGSMVSGTPEAVGRLRPWGRQVASQGFTAVLSSRERALTG